MLLLCDIFRDVCCITECSITTFTADIVSYVGAFGAEERTIQKEFGIPLNFTVGCCARVMLRKNKTKLLANGSLGTVEQINQLDKTIHVRFARSCLRQQRRKFR